MKHIKLVLAFFVGWFFALLVTSCEMPWEDDDKVSGSSSIEGNVVSFTTAHMEYTPAGKEHLPSSIIDGISELLVPSAYAAGASGVSVSVQGTGLSTTTADNGYFIITGVPAGNHKLIFEFGGQTATFEITVGSNETIELSGIQIDSDGNVGVSDIIRLTDARPDSDGIYYVVDLLPSGAMISSYTATSASQLDYLAPGRTRLFVSRTQYEAMEAEYDEHGQDARFDLDTGKILEPATGGGGDSGGGSGGGTEYVVEIRSNGSLASSYTITSRGQLTYLPPGWSRLFVSKSLYDAIEDEYDEHGPDARFDRNTGEILDPVP